MKLVAIDFETADRSADSACAIGIVSIEKGKITKKGYRLIRPPRRHFIFSYIHGISWADVEAQPTFIEVWDQFVPFWKDADYFLAHYAPFDRNVLTACCSAARRRPPRVPFICTVRVARSHWNFRPANLPTVCTQLGISLKHHNAASDALACASIALRAMKEGLPDSLSRSWRQHVEAQMNGFDDELVRHAECRAGGESTLFGNLAFFNRDNSNCTGAIGRTFCRFKVALQWPH